MAADRTRTTLEENDEVHSSDLGLSPDHGCSIPKRHARVTVKYNRKELQRRLDVEKWIDESLDRLYSGQERDMPEEVNIDDLIDLPNDEERVKKLQISHDDAHITYTNVQRACVHTPTPTGHVQLN
uniref:Protein phosphatase 1, regulatory (inhibitor) subunit 14Aa n=1 Tax=Dicentrarchus labrax TaxID=13489 RepID=A0A8C4E392_DICLA